VELSDDALSRHAARVFVAALLQWGGARISGARAAYADLYAPRPQSGRVRLVRHGVDDTGAWMLHPNPYKEVGREVE